MNHYKGKRKTKTSTYLSNGRNMEDKNVDYLQGKGTISKLFPLFGFITIENTCDETVYFDAFCFEDGKAEKLLDLPLKVGQEVTFLANKGCDGSNAKYRAYRVWRPEYHKIFSSDGLLGRKSTFSLSSSSNLSNVSCQDSDILITGSEKPNYYTSSTFSSSSTVSEKCASNTCQEPKKLTEHNGKIYPKGEKKAQIIFGTPEECVLVINDIVFYNQNPVTNLIWHIDDGERVKFDAIETDSFHGFRWIATIVWIGNRPKCSLTDDLKNKDNMEKLIKKYSCIFESKCNFSSSLTCSADENKGFENKDAGLSVNDACSCTSSGFSEDENENNHVSNCQVENSSRYRKKSRSDYVSGRLHQKFQKENTQTIREQYLNSSCKKDQLVTFQKLSEGVLDLKEKYVEDVYGLKKDVKNIPGLTDENVKDIPGLTEEENVKDIPGLMEENVKDISGLTEENVNDIYGLTDENVKDIPGLTEENVNDVSELTEENVKDVPGLTEENVTYIPGLMKENLKDVLEPSVELFQRVLKHHPNIDEAVSVFCTITSCKSEIAHKPPLTKYSPFIVNINGENKIGEVTEEAKLIKIRTIDLKHNTSKSNAQKVKCPLLKNITFGTGTVKSVNECFVCLNIKDSVAPVFLSKIYVDGKEVSKTNRNLKSIFKENELVYFSYIHAFLSNNSEWAYVYLVWKGLKPKQFVEPTVEEFLEKLGFRNILLGSEIISHHKQEEQNHCGHKGPVLEVTYIKVEQDTSLQNKTKKKVSKTDKIDKVSKTDKIDKVSKTEVKRMATSKGQERSEVHELSHKMDNWSHPELREVCSNRPEENDGCFSNISTCCGILNSRVCKSTSSFVVKDGSTKVKGKEKVGKCDCSKKLESNQNTVVKDAVVAVPANLELTKRSESVRSQSLDKVSTTNPANLKLTPEISVDKVGCSNISESVHSQSLDKVSTTNPANLKLTPEISVDNVGCSKEFDLRLKKCTENKFNDEQNHSNIQEFKDVSECMNNTKQHRGLGMNTRSVCSEPVPSQSDIVKDVRLLNLPSLPAKTDKIRPSKNQNREQYEYDSSTSFDHTSFSCSKEINNGNIATVSFLTGDASPELKNTVLSAGNMFMNESFVASFSSLRSETPSNIKGAEPGDAPSLQSLKQKFETSGGVDLTSVGGTVRDSHGSFEEILDLVVQQATERVLAEVSELSFQYREVKPCVCMSQHENRSNKSDASVQTDSLAVNSDSTQTYATGEILFSEVFH